MAPHKLNDALYRGDARDEVRLPSPGADADIVAHVLARRGHETPFLSTSETREAAAHFAAGGRVWVTSAARASTADVRHLSRTELLSKLSQSKGTWRSHSERLRAVAAVKRHAEHLLDFTRHTRVSEPKLRELVDGLFDED